MTQTTITKQVQLIQATIEGKTGFLTTTSMWDRDTALTDNPTEAINFLGDPRALETALATVVVPGDAGFAKSGLRIDELPVVVLVDVTTSYEIVSTTVGRPLYT